MSAAESAIKSIEQTRQHGLEVMSIQEHHELVAQGGQVRRGDSLDACGIHQDFSDVSVLCGTSFVDGLYYIVPK